MRQTKQTSILLVVLVLALTQAACNLGAARPAAAPTPDVIATLAALVTATPAEQPTATPAEQPTATRQPTAEPTAQPTTGSVTLTGKRLAMQSGATSVQVNGSVSAGGRVSYLANAGAQQLMMVMLTSAATDLALEVQAPGGSYLIKTSDATAYWQGFLPSSGDYRIGVVSPSADANFILSVTIPARVNFAAGANSATLDGKIAGRDVNTYLLRALKDQTMTVTIDSNNDDVFLTIYGLQDGNPYVRSVMGQASHSFKLPMTQDYVIQCVNTGDSGETYTVKFTAK